MFIKKCRDLIYPYLITWAIMVLVSGINAYFSDINIYYSIKEYFFAGIYGSGSYKINGVKAIGAIWFLLALFFDFIVLTILIKLRIDKIYIIVFLFIIGAYTARIFFLPFSIQPALMTLSYFYLGYLLQKFNGLDRILSIKFTLLSLIIWGSSLYYGLGNIWLARAYYSHYILEYIVSLFAIIVVLNLSRLINRIPKINTVLNYCGRNSLKILCIHIVEAHFIPWQLVNKKSIFYYLIFYIKVMINLIGVLILNTIKYILEKR